MNGNSLGVTYHDESNIQVGLERGLTESLNYTFSSVKMHINFLPNNLEYLTNKVVLEIGPGQDLGIVLSLLALGAKEAFVIERFLSVWDDSFHPFYYAQLKELLMEEFPTANFTPFDNLLKTKNHCFSCINVIQLPLEDISEAEIPSNLIDITISNAVLEHLYDHRKAISNLGRISAKGSKGYHQVDMRDHRDFSRPLEYLTFDKPITVKDHENSGSTPRLTDYINFFESAGFKVNTDTDIYVNDDYLKEVLPRIRPEFLSLGEEALRPLSSRFHIEKM
jgi:SAM-dependent methyltransferase